MELIKIIVHWGVPQEALIFLTIVAIGIFLAVLFLSGFKSAMTSLATSAAAVVVSIFIIAISENLSGLYQFISENKFLIQLVGSTFVWLALTLMGQKS